ncbi:MAG: hypothetical protein E3J87_11125 [Candidatus Cloacimonadota bacterium]|nr:MAG: hypothetical protein E3J87_11125 [Candidatus Cloacimonadota bacterium]
MHERKKIREAKYFYSRMVQEQRNRDDFTYNLSAFLSSARSVLQYALTEAETKTAGKRWYNDCISASPVLKFFKDKRDINIHTEPIEPKAHYELTLTESIQLSESLSITVRDKNGNIKYQYSSDEPKPKPKKPETPAVTEIRYRFADWSGSEDVLTLCKKYIQELEDMIKDAVDTGFISG